MLNYIKILLIGVVLALVIGGGVILIGYLWAKANGKLADHPSQKKAENASYEAFAGGFNDEQAPVDFSGRTDSENDPEDDFSFEFDSEVDSEIDTVSFDD